MASGVVEQVLELVRDHYVFPEKAAEAVAAVSRHRAVGVYDGLDEPELAALLTEHLAAVCADKHLRVRERAPGPGAPPRTPEQFEDAWREQLRLANHGIAGVQRLDGNVGYLDLRLITGPEVGGPAITAAMELVAGTHALIVDLRRNRGGSPQGVTYWCSYLFPDDLNHLNDIYDRETGVTRQFWTLAHLPGPRYLDRPVWVLTSSATFSGGEELGYNLQALGRAVLVGETTAGGAHPCRGFPLTDTLEITVPFARSINPVTGTNWEGTGVTPDIAVPADEALPLARRRALEHVIATATDTGVRAEARLALAG